MKALSFALNKLSRRSMTVRALGESLEKAGFSSDDVSYVIEECKKIGALNDEEWILTKLRRLKERRKSRFEIVLYFRKYGFSKEVIEPLLPEDNSDALKLLIEKKYPQLLEQPIDEKKKRKALQALLRRGFSFDEIRKTLIK